MLGNDDVSSVYLTTLLLNIPIDNLPNLPFFPHFFFFLYGDLVCCSLALFLPLVFLLLAIEPSAVRISASVTVTIRAFWSNLHRLSATTCLYRAFCKIPAFITLIASIALSSPLVEPAKRTHPCLGKPVKAWYFPSFLAQEPSSKLRTLSPKPRIFQICTVSSPCCPPASAMCDCSGFSEFPFHATGSSSICTSVGLLDFLRFLPITFRDFLIDEVWGPLIEISNFFKALTALIIQVSNMEMWEKKIVEIICKLEKVFPPAFFDSMEHLAIHLPYAAKVGGPVQFCWISQGGEQVVISEVMQLPYVVEEECVEEDEDEEEEFDGRETSEEKLEEKLSRAVPKTGHGMDKGDDTPVDPSQRKLLSLNRRASLRKRRGLLGRIFREEDDARVYKIWRLHCRNNFQDEHHRAQKAWVRYKKLPEFMHKDAFKILLAKWGSPKYIALQERGQKKRAKGDHVTHTTGCISIGIHEDRLAAKRGVRLTPLESYLLTHMTRRSDAPKDAPPTWICPQVEQTYNDAHKKYVEKHGPNKDLWPQWDPLVWKEVVGPPKKGQMRGMSTLQDPVEHGIPWRWYDMSEASSSTTRILTIQVQQLQSKLTQVREEMVERVQTKVATCIHTEVSQRVSDMEASFERRFQEHMRLLSQQYSMNATQPQISYPSFTPPQTAGPSFRGFRPDHLPPPT
ncbi:hypothetical protein SLEP1_g39484 [Rubroshorea leprosula]|uniref:DUF4218 domain-containing protein n=1 Tax=Rubroshorea leprosula TaxID=152421 RepID=A0AAV5L0B7_9ROSI|nr:hypothetical protein SLEP1_g39484 [Rubroshorea leprosula]